MVTPPGLGKFCGKSSAGPKVGRHDHFFREICSRACMLEPDEWSSMPRHEQHLPGQRALEKSSTWLVEAENAFSSRRVIFCRTRPRQIERQKWCEAPFRRSMSIAALKCQSSVSSQISVLEDTFWCFPRKIYIFFTNRELIQKVQIFSFRMNHLTSSESNFKV